jgi:hypothetical protein
MVTYDYGISDKIFAIMLDKPSSNKTAMHHLKPIFFGYIGLRLASLIRLAWTRKYYLNYLLSRELLV